MGRTIVITGANRGIGLAMARRAAGEGARVVALCRRPGEAEALEALARGPGSVEVMGADVTRPQELDAAAEAVGGPVDVLVCNAGQYLARGRIDDPAYTPEAWSEVMMTNVAGVFFTVRAFLARLEAAEAPKIAVISSIMASSARAPGGSYIYRASKAAATNLARNLAADLEPRGIAVGAFHPGWVRTEMGGASADVGVEESARGLLWRISALDLATTGVFEDFEGKEIAF